MLDNPLLPLFLTFGAVFGVIGALAAYLISYHEYRGRRLHPGQDPKRLALGTATTTFVFFLVASVVLAFLLKPAG
jgi:hypothetical protein